MLQVIYLIQTLQMTRVTSCIFDSNPDLYSNPDLDSNPELDSDPEDDSCYKSNI